jgi:hypothetical protein
VDGFSVKDIAAESMLGKTNAKRMGAALIFTTCMLGKI